MKKLLIITLVLLLIGGGWYFWSQKSNKEEITLTQFVTQPDLSNATFLIEGEEVTLEDGRSSTELAPGSAITLDTILTDNIVYGDINNDGKNDTVAILMQSGGGSGIFVYVVAYVSGNVDYDGTNAVLIGDRVSPQDISINDGVISVSYLDRGPEDALAVEPTISKVLEVIYRNGHLEER